MPDIPTTIEQDSSADKASKKYRGHPTVTVRQFLKMGYQQQREVDVQCEALLAGKVERHTVKPADGPAYVVTKKKPAA